MRRRQIVLKGGWKKVGRLASWAAVIGRIVGIAPLIGCDNPWSFVKAVEQSHDTYYRLKVKLAYKGEPQDFDIVVGCNIKVIRYKDNSSTYEVGLVPTVFGRRMSDGKGLVVRPPRACRGQTTANGEAQPDLLPIVIVYDDANTLDFGIAYLSEDAYEGPLSVLKFGGATIEKATRAEFDAFRRAQPNLVTRESYWSRAPSDVLKKMNLQRTAKPWAHICEGYKRFRIPDEARELIRQYWPNTHPNYWQTENADDDSRLYEIPLPQHRALTDRKNDIPRSPWAFQFPSDDAADYGAPNRVGGGRVSRIRGDEFAASYYPAADDYRIDKWPADSREWPSYSASLSKLADVDIDVRGGSMRGFAYCFASTGGTTDASEVSKRIIGRIDGQPIVSKRRPGGPYVRPFIILERDEYAFVFFRIYLESTRGDV